MPRGVRRLPSAFDEGFYWVYNRTAKDWEVRRAKVIPIPLIDRVAHRVGLELPKHPAFTNDEMRADGYSRPVFIGKDPHEAARNGNGRGRR